MFTEMWTSITAKAVSGGRKIGLVDEVAGIAGRYKRHQQAWSSHLAHTQAVIAQQLQTLPDEAQILILGSGLCLDVPLEQLARFQKVVLMDAVDTRPARKRRQPYPNLEFQLQDVTGFIQDYLDNKKAIVPSSPVDVSGYDLVISCNLLSQLPLLFVADVPPQTAEDKKMMRALQQAHLTLLQQAKSTVLLIGDYRYTELIELPTKSQQTQVDTVVADLLEPYQAHKIAHWDWQLAPKGELHQLMTLTLHVSAWCFQTS